MPPSPYDASKGPLTNPRNLDKDTPMVGGGTWRTLINRVDDLEKEVTLLKRPPTPPQGLSDQLAVQNTILQDTRTALVTHIDYAIKLKATVDHHTVVLKSIVRGIERLSKGHSAGNLGLPSKEDLDA